MSTASPVATTSPVKKAVVPRKTAAARKIEEQNAAAAAPAVTPAVDANTNAPEVAAPPAKKPRARKGTEPAAAAASPAASPAVSPAVSPAASAAAPPPAPKVTKKRKAPAAETADPAVAAAEVSTNGDNAVDGDAVKKAKKPREVKPKQVFIEGYGDLDKSDTDRLYTVEEFDEWVKATTARVQNQRFKDWVRAKKAFYKNIKTLVQQRKKKRTQKQVDHGATAEKQLRRLLESAEISAEDWSSLDNSYLAGHGFEGSFSAEELTSASLPEKAIPIYTVFKAAVSKGLHPLGIVSENRKMNKPSKDMLYVTNINEKRVYVGIALPFQKLEASPFAIKPEDRAFLGEDAVSEVSAA